MTRDLLAFLRDRADAADSRPDWPAESWAALRDGGVMRWVFDRPAVDLLTGYEQLAAACLTTTFILSQRDAAARRIRELSQGDFWRNHLAALTRGDSFWTVGLSQLTTSRQHTAPALLPRIDADGSLTLDGYNPCITGADPADRVR